MAYIRASSLTLRLCGLQRLARLALHRLALRHQAFNVRDGLWIWQQGVTGLPEQEWGSDLVIATVGRAPSCRVSSYMGALVIGSHGQCTK